MDSETTEGKQTASNILLSTRSPAVHNRNFSSQPKEQMGVINTMQDMSKYAKHGMNTKRNKSVFNAINRKVSNMVTTVTTLKIISTEKQHEKSNSESSTTVHEGPTLHKLLIKLPNTPKYEIVPSTERNVMRTKMPKLINDTLLSVTFDINESRKSLTDTVSQHKKPHAVHESKHTNNLTKLVMSLSNTSIVNIFSSTKTILISPTLVSIEEDRNNSSTGTNLQPFQTTLIPSNPVLSKNYTTSSQVTTSQVPFRMNATSFQPTSYHIISQSYQKYIEPQKAFTSNPQIAKVFTNNILNVSTSTLTVLPMTIKNQSSTLHIHNSKIQNAVFVVTRAHVQQSNSTYSLINIQPVSPSSIYSVTYPFSEPPTASTTSGINFKYAKTVYQASILHIPTSFITTTLSTIVFTTSSTILKASLHSSLVTTRYSLVNKTLEIASDVTSIGTTGTNIGGCCRELRLESKSYAVTYQHFTLGTYKIYNLTNERYKLSY